MKPVRLLSAFLFALTALVVAYGAFWLFITWQMREAITAALQPQGPLVPSYESIERRFDPLRASFVVHDLAVSYEDPGKSRATWQAGDVEIKTDLFGGYSMRIAMPPTQDLHIETPEAAKDYRILSEKGMLSLYTNDAENYEVLLEALTLVVQDRTQNMPENVLSTRNIYLAYDDSRSASQYGWRFTAKHLETEHYPLIDSLRLGWRVKNMPPLEPSLIANLREAETPETKVAAVTALLEEAARYNTVLYIDDIGLRVGELKLDVSGDVAVDERLRPEGRLNLMTNAVGALVEWLSKNNMVRTGQGQFVAGLMQNSKASINLQLTASSGALQINGIPIGLVPGIPQMLEQHYAARK